MKFVEPRSYADPEAAARKLVEIASTIEPVRNGRVYIELVNAPLLDHHKGSPADTRPASTDHQGLAGAA